MKSAESYSEGKKDGRWTYWHRDGEKWKDVLYLAGELIEEKIYSPE